MRIFKLNYLKKFTRKTITQETKAGSQSYDSQTNKHNFIVLYHVFIGSRNHIASQKSTKPYPNNFYVSYLGTDTLPSICTNRALLRINGLLPAIKVRK